MVRFARGGYLYVGILALLVVFFWILSFQTSFAQPAGGLIPCIGGTECTICHLVQLGQNIINFFVYASVAVATLLFINAGVLYIFSPGNPGNISRGHRIFTNTLVGILIILSSWIVVDFVIRSLVDPALLVPGPPGSGTWGPWNEILCAPSPVGPVAPPPAPAPPVVGGPRDPGRCADIAGFAAANGVPFPARNDPALDALIACYRAQPAVAALLDVAQIYTTDRTHDTCNYTRGDPICEPAGVCSHSVNSSHYGGFSGTTGAQGVDFNSIGSEVDLCRALAAARPTCRGVINWETNHTHISLDTSDRRPSRACP